MSSVAAAKGRRLAGTRARSGQPADNLRFDCWMVLVSGAMVFGLFIDGYAHNHGMVDDTFFTPWHALLYGAYGVAALSLAIQQLRHVSQGFHWRRALPSGYMPALFGAGIFAVAGFGDMLWHESFGIETGLEPLLSPTHLLLATAGMLIITGPIRAFWRRETDHDWHSLLPLILAFATVAAVFTFFTVFAGVSSRMAPLTGPRPADTEILDPAGVQAFLMHSNILLGVILFMTRRWRLPFGAITLIFVINAMGMTWINVRDNAEFIFVVNAAIVGLFGDWLLSRTVYASKNGLRLFCFLLPLAFSAGAMLCVHLLGASVWGDSGLWWEIHMWLGAPVLAGIFGYGLSLLLHPPAVARKPV